MLTYARLMEEADAFCAAGEVISLAPDAEVYALRRWTVEEFLRQYHGAAPRPWPGIGRPGERCGERPAARRRFRRTVSR